MGRVVYFVAPNEGGHCYPEAFARPKTTDAHGILDGSVQMDRQKLLQTSFNLSNYHRLE
ncbi:MAG TPA: hypothetical protein VEO37_06635 [Thermoanaerobaculia bacterium]|nr:hypothetical protein [Thermoanaerobaculia bacterium]